MSRKLIIVGQKAGGVGKSTIAIHLAELHRAVGETFVVIDADDKNRTATGGSALSHALPHHNVLWLGCGPSDSAMRANRDAGNAHWDKVRQVLDHEDVILDLGANVIQRFVEYAVGMRAARRWAEDGIDVEVWVPVTNSKVELEEGLSAVKTAGAAFGAAGLRVVRNLRDGAFDAWKGSPQGKALDELEKAGVCVVDFAEAPVPPDGLNAMKKGPWSPFQIAEMGWRATATTLDLPAPVAERTFYGCEDWIDAVKASFVPVALPGKQ